GVDLGEVLGHAGFERGLKVFEVHPVEGGNAAIRAGPFLKEWVRLGAGRHRVQGRGFVGLSLERGRDEEREGEGGEQEARHSGGRRRRSDLGSYRRPRTEATPVWQTGSGARREAHWRRGAARSAST